MIKVRPLLIALILSSLLFSAPQTVHSQESGPVVRAVLFYSPTCPHCHQVITQDLPPLFATYGTQLEVIGIDISFPEGHALYEAAIEHFGIGEERWGVPMLIVGDAVLVGSLEIPTEFPGLIEDYLAQGGVGWPDIPGLGEVLLQTAQTEAASAAVVQPTSSITDPDHSTVIPDVIAQAAKTGSRSSGGSGPDWIDMFARDLAGNSLSVMVLIAMLGAILWVPRLMHGGRSIMFGERWVWVIPLLSIIGAGIAGYLAYVETAQVPAFCGPVGDCNTVQQSEYARLFGVIPIGLLGLLGYMAIVTAWLGVRLAHGRLLHAARLCLFCFTALGTLFSVYLTYLEPFVIGATCIWCLSSAVLMTLLMLLSVKPAQSALSARG